jgi:hypothetical protein
VGDKFYKEPSMADLIHPESQGRHTQHSRHGVSWRGCAHPRRSIQVGRIPTADIMSLPSRGGDRGERIFLPMNEP